MCISMPNTLEVGVSLPSSVSFGLASFERYYDMRFRQRNVSYELRLDSRNDKGRECDFGAVVSGRPFFSIPRRPPILFA